eukprot:1808914-Amphidinium_carterae.1
MFGSPKLSFSTWGYPVRFPSWLVPACVTGPAPDMHIGPRLEYDYWLLSSKKHQSSRGSAFCGDGLSFNFPRCAGYFVSQ